jgi:hypothetical protein
MYYDHIRRRGLALWILIPRNILFSLPWASKLLGGLVTMVSFVDFLYLFFFRHECLLRALYRWS